jgi:hypothetical protein
LRLNVTDIVTSSLQIFNLKSSIFNPPMLSRRAFAGTLSSAGAVWLGADLSQLRQAVRAALQSSPGQLTVLTPAEARALDALTAQFLPSDDLPGAREANVVRFIDQSLGTFAKGQRGLFQQGLKKLDQVARQRHPKVQGFADLKSEDQLALMRTLEATPSDFFEAALVATMTGMFADPAYGGNSDKVGWQMIGFEDRFAWQPPFGEYDV